MTLEELAARVRDGDQASFEKLAERLRPLLRMCARLQFAAGQETADYMQAALIGLWQACDGYEAGHGTTFSTFAELVIRREILQHTTAHTRQKHWPLSLARSLDAPIADGDAGSEPLHESIPSPLPAAEEWIELRDTVRAVIAGIGTLSTLERESLIGYVFNGECYVEIEARILAFDAERAGRAGYGPVKVVDNAITRARWKLRRILTEREAA